MVALSVNKDADDWDLGVQASTYAYNSAVQTSTGFTPSALMMGRQLRSPVDLPRPDLVENVRHLPAWDDNLQQKLAAAHRVAREAIAREQRCQANFYDHHVRNQFNIQVGCLTWVSKIPRGPGIFKFKHAWQEPALVVKEVGLTSLECVTSTRALSPGCTR